MSSPSFTGRLPTTLKGLRPAKLYRPLRERSALTTSCRVAGTPWSLFHRLSYLWS